MNKVILPIIIFVFASTASVYAQAPTTKATPTPTTSRPTPTAGEDVLSKQINSLKDRIASRVAELKLVEKRGIMGSVTDTSTSQITLSDIHGNTKFIDVDELTKFSSPSAKSTFGISDITKDANLGVIGLYNKQSRRLLARFVDVITPPKVLHGIVQSKDPVNFTVTVASEKNEETIVDVEAVTKTLSFDLEDGFVRSGFSKIEQDSNIIVIGFPDAKGKKRMTASRFLIFPGIPPNPKISLQEKTPSTGSGKKLTPITR